MKYPFSFRVRGYNDGDNTYYEQCGMGICESYADAVAMIEGDFGDELMAIKHLVLHEAGNLIYMPYDTMKQIAKETFYGGSATYEVQISREEAQEI